MKRLAICLVVTVSVALCALAASGVASASGPYTTGQAGADISWPQCNFAPPQTPFGIVGVTNGKVFTANPCLRTEASAYGKNVSFYVNTGFNDRSPHTFPSWPRKCAHGDALCLAYNYGYNGGVAAVDVADKLKVTSDKWWLDVETLNTWNRNVDLNRASIRGTFDALIKRGVKTVGVYSTMYQWGVITGGWQNGWANWVATGAGDVETAKGYCKGNRFTGGPTWIVQYIRRVPDIPRSPDLDMNYAC